MILIDLGNTSAKIYDKSQSTIPTSEILDYLDSVKEQILLCSVVPDYNNIIKERYKNIRIITNKDYKLMFDDVNSILSSKGADRIVATYGAVQKYHSKVIVVDVGTCVTFDVVNNRQYISGLIYPGFEMLENILTEKIKQLPSPAFDPSMILTEHQIYWANIYGFIGAIKHMLANLIPDGDYQVILTGGTVAKLLEEHNIDLISELSDFNVVYDPILVKEGLVKLSNLI